MSIEFFSTFCREARASHASNESLISWINEPDWDHLKYRNVLHCTAIRVIILLEELRYPVYSIVGLGNKLAEQQMRRLTTLVKC